MHSKTNETALEACIESYLSGGVSEVLVHGVVTEPTPDYGSKGYVRGTAADYNAEFAIDEAKFWQFVEATQGEELAKLHYKPDYKRQVLESRRRSRSFRSSWMGSRT